MAQVSRQGAHGSQIRRSGWNRDRLPVRARQPEWRSPSASIVEVTTGHGRAVDSAGRSDSNRL
jgi:hypothetical protein